MLKLGRYTRPREVEFREAIDAARDYERRIDVSTAMIHVAMGGLRLRRNAHR